MKFMDLCQILLDINDEKPEAEKYLKEMHDLNLIKILSEEESKKQKKYRNLLRSEDQYSLRTKESYYLQKKGKLEIKLKECDNSFEKLPNKKRFVEKKNQLQMQISQIKTELDNVCEQINITRRYNKYTILYDQSIKFQPMVLKLIIGRRDKFENNEIKSRFDLENLYENSDLPRYILLSKHLEKFGIE